MSFTSEVPSPVPSVRKSSSPVTPSLPAKSKWSPDTASHGVGELKPNPEVTRTVPGAVPSLVDLVPAAGWDEREAHDLYGVRFDGHEPLRPLVDHDLDVTRWTVPVEGRDSYQVAVGPIHAGVIESGHFRFHLVGERILHLDARLFYKQALATYRDGRPGMAIAVVRQALALDETLAEAHYLLGMSLAAEGQTDGAMTSLRRAVEISPAFSAAREELAVLFAARGRTRDAIEELEALAALEPARPERLVNVGLAYARAGRTDAAIQTLGRAVERYPDEQVVYAALGRVWLDEAGHGDPVAIGNAVTALEAAIARDGASGPTLAMFGRALLLAGDLPRAEGVLQQATARLPVDPRAYRDLAEAARRLGHAAVAQDAARRSAALANIAP
jgi:tetratricopeptide (TPR) repeat protein